MTTQLDIFSTEPKPKPVKVSRALSSKQRAIVECLKMHGLRPLPKNLNPNHKENDIVRFVSPDCPVYWAYSWEICSVALTADYRRRIFEVRERGYEIRRFRAGKRHGYVLLKEPD